MLAWARNRALTKLSTSDILTIADDNPTLVKAVDLLSSNKFVKKFIGIGTAAVCYYAFSKIDKIAADEFFYLLEKGSDLPAGDPILLLRNYLTIREHVTIKGIKGGNYRSAYVIALIVKSWNLKREDRKIKQLTFKLGTDNYPIVV